MALLADCWLCTRWQWAAMLEQPNSVSHMHVVNLSYWKTGIRGAPLHFLFKQAITPLHHYHREKGENEPQLRFSGRDLFNALILGAGKVLREEVIKTAPSSEKKKIGDSHESQRNWTAAFNSQLDFMDAFLLESTWNMPFACACWFPLALHNLYCH